MQSFALEHHHPSLVFDTLYSLQNTSIFDGLRLLFGDFQCAHDSKKDKKFLLQVGQPLVQVLMSIVEKSHFLHTVKVLPSLLSPLWLFCKCSFPFSSIE